MNACFQRKCQCQARLSVSTALETDKFDCIKLSTQFVKVQFSMDGQGFIQSGGGAGIPPLPPPPPSHNFLCPKIFKLSMVIILAIYMLLNVCVIEILSQIASEAVREVYKFKNFSGDMPPDPPSRHACISHTTIILLPSCPPPPTHNPV